MEIKGKQEDSCMFYTNYVFEAKKVGSYISTKSQLKISHSALVPVIVGKFHWGFCVLLFTYIPLHRSCLL